VSFTYTTPMVIVRRTATGRDADGNDVFAEQRIGVMGVLNPGTSSEVIQGRDTVTIKPSAYLPTGTDIRSSDALEAQGSTYEVVGTANGWVNPYTGNDFGVEVNLQEVTG
jgi:long-subunit fatty acid transport protein